MVYSMSFVMPFEQYPSEDFLDGNPRKIELAGPETKEKTILQIINKTRRYHLGMPVNSEHVPTVWQWASSKTLPDCYQPFGFPCISTKVKSIIEEFEPDVHQFFPVQVVDKKKRPLSERWLWNVCNRIDSMDREHTTWIQKHGQSWFPPSDFSDDELPSGYDRNTELRLVVSNERVGNAQFWRDPNIIQKQTLFCSKVVGDALLAEGFTGLELAEWESV